MSAHDTNNGTVRGHETETDGDADKRKKDEQQQNSDVAKNASYVIQQYGSADAQMATETADEEDVHTCAKCKLLFTSLELYFKHKMNSKTCGKQFDPKNLLKRLGPRRGRPPGRKRQIHEAYNPKAVTKHLEHKTFDKFQLNPATQLNSEVEEKREKYNRLKLHHRTSDIIPNTLYYQCDKCDRHFRREAALNRHIEYDHRDSDGSDSYEDEAEPQLILVTDEEQIKSETADQEVLADAQPVQEIHYVETLTFDPSTGLYLKSTTPTVIETEGTFIIPSENQTEKTESRVVIAEASTKKDPDYLAPKINYLKSGRKTSGYSIKGKIDKLTKKKEMCNQCGKFLANASILAAHQVTHMSEREFKCTFAGCKYSFKTKGSLKRHIRRHTGERPFKCGLCHRAFRESGALTRHLKGRTPCTEKNDTDFPRYQKNLKFSSEVIKRETQDVEIEHTNIQSTDLMRSEIIVIREADDVTRVEVVDTFPVLEDVTLEDTQMVISEEDINAHQGLSLEIGDVQQDDVDEDDQQEDESDVHVEVRGKEIKVELLPAQENMAQDNLLQKDGEIIANDQIKSENNITNEEHSCSVDGQIFKTRDELIVHLKTHLLNINYSCDQCSYYAKSKDKMAEHMQLTHFKQWDIEPSFEAHESINATDATNMIHVPDAMSTIEEAGEVRFLTTGNDVSEEVIMLGDEVTMATTALEKDEQVQYVDMNALSTSEDHQGEGIDEDNMEELTQQTKEESDDSYKTQRIAKTALDQLLALSDPSGPRHDYCQQLKATCVVCGKKFKNQSYLRFHLRTHTGEKVHKCELCEKTFISKDGLNKHYATHSTDRNYKCGECGKFFKRISHVREHLKVHASERPYACKFCTKTFKSVNSCKVHIRTHSMEMRYKCDACDRQFREKASLDRHERIHTGEKPFPCPHCGRKFAEHGTLNRHLKAKVPCSNDLQRLRFTDVSQLVSNEHPNISYEHVITPTEGQELSQTDTRQDLFDSPQVKLEMLTDEQVESQSMPETDGPTMLTEFSSIADTQEYIIDTRQQESATEYVMVTEQHEQMLLEGTIETTAHNANEQQIEYIVMDQGNMDNIIFIDQKTGQQVQLLPSGVLPSGQEIVAMEVNSPVEMLEDIVS